MWSIHESVIVVGEKVNLWVISTDLAKLYKHIYFYKPAKKIISAQLFFLEVFGTKPRWQIII